MFEIKENLFFSCQRAITKMSDKGQTCFESLPNSDLDSSAEPPNPSSLPAGFKQPVTQDAKILARYTGDDS